MKILHVSYSKYGGGAGASARRLNQALINVGIDSDFIYFKPFRKDTAHITLLEKKINGLVNILIRKFFGIISINFLPTRVLKAINESDADIVHLHWIHAEMMSVKQIAMITKPLVWTFHDMWAFCGIQHCVEDDSYIKGYSSNRGIDGWVYRKKIKYWKGLKVNIVCPSQWMADCIQSSNLFRGYPVKVIPNALDLNVFKPSEKIAARKKFGLPLDKKLILTGANGNNPRKGGYLLEAALGQISSSNVELVVFGATQIDSGSGVPVKALGMIGDEEELSALYSAVDVMCVPSRIESFGLTAAEPLACGTPVVAFNVTGLKDVVDHKINGYLAEPFDPSDFAAGIDWVLALLEKEPEAYKKLSIEGRSKAELYFSAGKVAQEHMVLYSGVFACEQSN